jgi:3D (Asp-Asp-Asp) domain-containing protein
MQPHKHPIFTAKSALVASLCLVALLPSCALKRLNDQNVEESAAANAQSLEDALAILDQAMEETAPASKINSIPLTVPARPEDIEEDLELFQLPVVETLEIDPSEVDAFEFDPSDTLFAVEGETAVEAAEAPSVPPLEQEEETVAPKTTHRERIVVQRPSPSYSPDIDTTYAIDEFRNVRTTAYNHSEEDHIKYGELSAMGKPLRFGMVRSAAADWSRYPVGTRFRIVGKPYEYVIDDYGSALVGTDTIDLYKPSGGRMDDWGVREVEIEIIAWGSFGKSLEILEPRKEFGEHIGQMISAISEQPQDQAIADGGNDASIRPSE